MNHPLWVMFKKELTRVFTDKRLIFSTFILPALSTFLLYAAVGSFTKTFNEQLKSHVPVVGLINLEESFQSFLIQQDDPNLSTVQWLPLSSEREARTLIGDAEMDAAFVMTKTSEDTPTIRLLFNPDKEFSVEAYRNLGALLDEYKEQEIAKLLKVKNIAQIFYYDSNDPDSKIVTPNGPKDTLMSRMIPMMLSILLFSGCLGIGIDSIAGEKERGTLATLLMTPAPREMIAFGKILSLCVLAIFCAIFSGLGLFAALPFIKNLHGSASGATLASLPSFSFVETLTLLGLLILLAASYASVICLISIIARSLKEASTYAAPVYLMVTLTSYQALFTVNTDPGLFHSMIPIYSLIMALRSFFSGALSSSQATLACLSTFLFITILVILIKELFNNEQVILRQ